MPTYDKDNKLIFGEPEPEGPVFPGNKVSYPIRRQPKLTARRKARIKRALIKFFLALVIIISALTYGAYKVNQFFSTHELHFRSPLQMPVQVLPRGYKDDKPQAALVSEVYAASPGDERPASSGVRTTPVLESKTSVSSIVSAIYRLESSGGKHDPCRASGRYNGYGFAPGTCYRSHAEVTKLVTNWVEARIDTMPLNKLLCTYNLGPNSENLDDCMAQSKNYPYYKNYLSLN